MNHAGTDYSQDDALASSRLDSEDARNGKKTEKAYEKSPAACQTFLKWKIFCESVLIPNECSLRRLSDDKDDSCDTRK